MEVLLKFIKFGVVGISGMIIDFSVTWIFKEKAKLNKYVANSLGFVTAASTNYVLNRKWTFDSHEKNIPVEFLSFLTVSVIGLLLNNLIIYLLTEKFRIKFYTAKFVAIGIVVFWNFFANYLFTFKH